MTESRPQVGLDARYSSDGATPAEWDDVRRRWMQAAVAWVSTVRRDGRPHVTPLLVVWLDRALYFCTGPDEQKARNLARNPRCSLTTGCNDLDGGVDLVVDGDAVRVRDDGLLRRVAQAYEAKYGQDWHFDVRDGVFVHAGGEALVFEVVPWTAYAFAKGDPFAHTRFRFDRRRRGEQRPAADG